MPTNEAARLPLFDSTAKVRYVMIGGFLGAGKTRTISNLARRLCDQGKRFGLLTNLRAQMDQLEFSQPGKPVRTHRFLPAAGEPISST